MEKKPAHTNKQHLSNVLSLYKDRFKPPQASVEKVFIQVVQEVTGFSLKPNQVNYSVGNKIISLQVSSLIKTELKSKQQAIVERLVEVLPKQDVPKVIL